MDHLMVCQAFLFLRRYIVVAKIDIDLQKSVCSLVVENEYRIAKQNISSRVSDMNDIRDMFYCERSRKDYDWQSNIFIPKVPQHIWAGISKMVKMYFSTRDRVKVLPIGKKDKNLSRAASKLLNRILNKPELHFFVKFVKALVFAFLYGDSTIKGWWVQETEERITGQSPVSSPVFNETGDITGINQEVEEIKETIPIKDYFDCQVYDPRNVFYSPEITHSAQDKRYVIFRSVEDYISLKREAGRLNYFNLEKLVEDEQTETDKDTDNVKQKQSAIFKDIEILERLGTFPVRRTAKGDVMPGLDQNGRPLDNAKWEQMIITVANINSKPVLIRFDQNKDGFIQVARLYCYIDPHKEHGIGQGTYTKDLQIAINDNFNMRNDSVILNTIGMNIVRKDAAIEWDTIVTAPGNNMMVEEPKEDIIPWRPGVNVTDAAMQHQLLDTELSRTTAEYPHSMGDMPNRREPATTSLMAQESGNYRNNLIALTLEYTGLSEFYNMVLKLADKYMHARTALEILEDDAQYLDLSGQYNYQPVSVSIEPEAQKMVKIQMLQNLIMTMSKIPNPKTVGIINKLMAEIFTSLGDEYEDFADLLLDEKTPIPAQGKDAGLSALLGGGASNELGMEQSIPEQMTRMIGTQAGGGVIG